MPVRSSAPLYQWGRKDPFPWGKVVFDAQDAPQTYITYRRPVQTSGALGQYAGYTGNTHYATAHPDTFIVTMDGTSYDWYYGAGKGNGPSFRNDELWGNPTGYEAGQKTVKTLFDPCPPGWAVPHPYVFTAFTKTGASASGSPAARCVCGGRSVQGWNFLYNGIVQTYYPGVGYRYDELGLFDIHAFGLLLVEFPGARRHVRGVGVRTEPRRMFTNVIPDPRGFRTSGAAACSRPR